MPIAGLGTVVPASSHGAPNFCTVTVAARCKLGGNYVRPMGQHRSIRSSYIFSYIPVRKKGNYAGGRLER
jgi:hypothetical protein